MRVLQFDLTRQKPSKTLDIGLNGTSISTDPLGRILQLSNFHPEHGIVVAAPYEQFDGSKFYEPMYVRSYRARMLKMIQLGQPGFGLRFEGSPSNVSIEIQDLNMASVKYQLRNGIMIAVTLSIDETGIVTQSATISSSASETTQIAYTLGLGISVNRASYGQLTEGGPIPIPQSENKFQVFDQGRRYTIANRHLGALLEGSLSIDETAVELAGVANGIFLATPVAASFSDKITLSANASRSLTARFRLSPEVVIPEKSDILYPGQFHEPHLTRDWSTSENQAMFIVRRNLEYILGNCTIPVSDSEVAIVTDHVALPLGWNRDNYWQIRFLLDVNRNIHRLMGTKTAQRYHSMIQSTVKGHLNWVFRRAERPFSFWHRSYLVTGRPKDGPVFQLDQQCYPLLELCDFLTEFPEEFEFVQSVCKEKTIFDIVTLLKSKQDLGTGLFPTDETPGDDAVEHPFHFSSHVLLWKTFSRLHELLKDLGMDSTSKSLGLNALAKDVRHSTMRHFQVTNSQTGKPMFAYLTSGTGKTTLYHDANDIPTLLAPAWNFVQSDWELELWRNTMDFGTSPLNEKGYFIGGPFGGLGSVHTPGPWPLGYFQEFVYSQIKNDTMAEENAWRRIKGAMLWDGLFSEAIDDRTAACTSKAWFSWPGSMIGGVLVNSRNLRKYLAS